MEGPHIQVTSTGARLPLLPEVTTVGRGKHVDVRLADPSVSLLHAEIVRRGPYVYVMDLGLSRNGTRVNGRLIARRVLCEGDAITFGSARCRIFGIDSDEEVGAEQYRSAAPELTRREIDVIASLCRPAMSENAFVAPATAREIAADLVVTEAAVKQHLLRLYSKLRIVEGPNRRVRLANEVISLGLAKPELPGHDNGARTPQPTARPTTPQPPMAAPPPAPSDRLCCNIATRRLASGSARWSDSKTSPLRGGEGVVFPSDRDSSRPLLSSDPRTRAPGTRKG